MTSEGTAIATEYLTAFVKEAIDRAVQQAKTESSETVEGDHLEKIIPQLVSGRSFKYRT